jgi:hypothetical protein
MPFAVLFVMFVMLVLIVRAKGGGRNTLLQRGVRAHGIILQADQFSTETSYLGQRFELRNLTLDVEIPGQAPYEVRFQARVPRIVEALPGATLDLRVSPSNQSSIEIVGPAGASDWIDAASRVPGQTWGPALLRIPGASSAPRGCGTIVLVLIGMSLALASVLTFVAEARKPAPTAAPAHLAPTTQTRPTPQPPGRGGARPAHPH